VSVSAYLIGVRNMDGTFDRMMVAKKFCDEQELSYPAEVAEYFGHLADESEAYIREQMAEIILAYGTGSGWRTERGDVPIEIGAGDMTKWASINVADIPEGIESLKVMLSW